MSSSLASFATPSPGTPVGPQPAFSTRERLSSPTSTLIPTTSETSTSTSPTSFTSNAALYLYTFLATLVLLLAVSSAIVVRSVILRRRNQRLVEEAIRAGTWALNPYDPRSGRKRRDIGKEPKLCEAWLRPTNDNDDGADGAKGKWSDIMPVCASYINQLPASTSSRPALSTESAESVIEPQSRPSRFLRPFTGRLPTPSPQLAAVSSTAAQVLSSSSSSPTRSSSPAVRVAVLIAMPAPLRKLNCDEDGPPVVEIGVIEVGVKDNDGESPGRDVS
ncbi:hypothetical protein PAXRUDRAFT_832059 [Paxillus rubicundulus Ve08.2h10]|uniref:Uncharacterized protein n=1 Tax=Paxillus rubicundulus Ve08.2h10 TaxID=930991 RepID=A0A0D0DFN5_9AGAM|nr:hypothetical protein PAXRUDRAFT_832059 [Paxillus rubicundulus Ve08.2h10]